MPVLYTHARRRRRVAQPSPDWRHAGAGDEAEGGDSTAAAYRDPCGAGQLTTNAVVAEAETLAAAAEPAATEPEAEAAEAAEAATVAEPGAAAPAGDEPTGGC
mmetsp:Transcript_42897/g.140893  ORF Transcript_42897/g.140893 Transcript_42897/m.140893 type:complete len:103 (-) Transcript_42897:193-501(-)